jgi:hypothetical protein
MKTEELSAPSIWHQGNNFPYIFKGQKQERTFESYKDLRIPGELGRVFFSM